MRTTEIRKQFLDYFNNNDHQVVSSSPLVPDNDPTLLFVNAGMVQFKDLFLGLEKRPYKRAATSQRCVRAGGKHNDLENVGYTARHHTFFEMLGNFSFGDYFKDKAIFFAWEFLTEVAGLPADKLWVTVFEDDDEAAEIWLRDIGVPEERFARIGEKDNFWAMGDTGPCGPCSEIFYDHGPAVAGGPPGSPDEDGDRYVEIWNLVFMQFNRTEAGVMEPLPKPSVDTGMGLERLATILQNVHSNYEIDLFQNLIAAAAQVVRSNDLQNKSLRVLADHIRSTSFLIADGVTPSNEGRGYVLRRIIRRAIRHGYQLGQKRPFLHRLVPALVEQMGDAYPELVRAQAHVERVLRQEGEKFAETLETGLAILAKVIDDLPGDTIPGDVVFKLYDTYGFPVDLTNDVAREHQLVIDVAGYEENMAQQREQAKAAHQFGGYQRQVTSAIETSTEFLGYQALESSVKVLEITQNDERLRQLDNDQPACVVLDSTPFYAESGGQVGDKGVLRSAESRFVVEDTQKLANNVYVHLGRLERGRIAVGDALQAEVPANERRATARNHSATHLMHAALREILGDHVQQKGSLVDAARLRFDFSHFQPLTEEEITRIEKLVNREIRDNHAVVTALMDLEEAKQSGAAALFGEKYDARVRVVDMGEFSKELCGGTHVDRTGDIGFFKIVSETGIAAGVRRIEALTGYGAEEHMLERLKLLRQTEQLLKASSGDLLDKARQLTDRVKNLDKEVQQLQGKLALAGDVKTPDDIVDVDGIKLLVTRRDGVDAKTLRSTMDALRESLGSGVVLLAAVNDGRISLVAGVSDDLTDRLHAGKLIQHVAGGLGGKGGGKATMAQGGGSDTAKLDQILNAVPEWLGAQTT